MPTTDSTSATTDTAPADLAAAPINVTDTAMSQIRITREQEGMDSSFGLRVAVRGGGCSGFEYALDFDQEQRDTDFVIEQGDLRIYIDAVSARYLQGTTVDYVKGVMGSGFKFENPNAA